MADDEKKPSLVKSIMAIFVGFVTVAGLSVATDSILEAVGVFPPASQAGLFVTWMLALALIYRMAYAVLGGYVAAMLAPVRPMLHVNILAVIGTIAGILGIIAGWNLSEHWYPIALAISAYPCVWYGGKLRVQKKKKSS